VSALSLGSLRATGARGEQVKYLLKHTEVFGVKRLRGRKPRGRSNDIYLGAGGEPPNPSKATTTPGRGRRDRSMPKPPAFAGGAKAEQGVCQLSKRRGRALATCCHTGNSGPERKEMRVMEWEKQKRSQEKCIVQALKRRSRRIYAIGKNKATILAIVRAEINISRGRKYLDESKFRSVGGEAMGGGFAFLSPISNLQIIGILRGFSFRSSCKWRSQVLLRSTCKGGQNIEVEGERGAEEKAGRKSYLRDGGTFPLILHYVEEKGRLSAFSTKDYETCSAGAHARNQNLTTSADNKRARNPFVP